MKTLGELRVGDTFYIINWEAGYINSIHEHIVSIITEIQIGEIIKWIDKDGYIRARTIEKNEYDLTECTSAYCESICSDKEKIKELLDKDYKTFIKRYNKNLEILNKNENKN